MLGGQAEIRLRHARLHDDAASLFRALDLRDTVQIADAFANFTLDLDAHVHADVTTAYGGLLHHSSEFVRRLTERMLADGAAFPLNAEHVMARWRNAPAPQLLSDGFRDDLETLVSALLKRIRIEERLLVALASVA
jgi:hypothetical protein